MTRLSISYLILLSLLLFSCSKSKQEYFEWVVSPESELTKHIINNGVKVSVTRLPKEYMALRENPNLQEWDDALLSKYSDLMYFQITIESQTALLHKNDRNAEDHERLMYYYSFSMKQHIALESGEKKHYPCVLYHFERGASTSNKIVLLSAFDLPSTGEATLSVLLGELNFDKPLKFFFDTNVSQPNVLLR